MTVAQLIARAGGPNRLTFPRPRYGSYQGAPWQLALELSQQHYFSLTQA